MSLVRLFSYYPRVQDGLPRISAMAVEFATKTPLTIYFHADMPIAFNYCGRLFIAENSAPRKYLSLITAHTEPENIKWIHGIEVLGHRLDDHLRRFFEPPHLDAHTPPGIVSDWLRDMGLIRAADLVKMADEGQPT